jgi:hypothetical protein
MLQRQIAIKELREALRNNAASQQQVTADDEVALISRSPGHPSNTEFVFEDEADADAAKIRNLLQVPSASLIPLCHTLLFFYGLPPRRGTCQEEERQRELEMEFAQNRMLSDSPGTYCVVLGPRDEALILLW